jgi:hypothetical protein
MYGILFDYQVTTICPAASGNGLHNVGNFIAAGEN